MIEFEAGKWHLCSYKATFQSRGEKRVKYTSNPDRYEKLENMHDHITDMSIEEVEWDDGHKDRLAELNEVGVPQGFGSVARSYVENGSIDLEDLPKDYDLPIGKFRLYLEQQEQDDTIDDALELIFEQEGLI